MDPWAKKMKVDISKAKSTHSVENRARRALWSLVWLFLFRPSPRTCHAWRRLLLRLFGARVGSRVCVYPSCRIWAPWNLEIGDYSRIGDYVDCYCVDKIKIGAHATVSQYSYLCTATHDVNDPGMALVTKPIEICDGGWVCADVYVGPGVTIGEGAVTGARSVVIKDVEQGTVVAGNPATMISRRDLESAEK